MLLTGYFLLFYRINIEVSLREIYQHTCFVWPITVDSVHILGTTGQRIPVLWHILHIVENDPFESNVICFCGQIMFSETSRIFNRDLLTIKFDPKGF